MLLPPLQIHRFPLQVDTQDQFLSSVTWISSGGHPTRPALSSRRFSVNDVAQAASDPRLIASSKVLIFTPDDTGVQRRTQ
jgi:hypothetical protein